MQHFSYSIHVPTFTFTPFIYQSASGSKVQLEYEFGILNVQIYFFCIW